MRRKVHQTRFVFFAATGVLILLLAQRRTDSQSRENLTNPLPDLTSAQLMDFNDGLDEFEEVETFDEGLGPVFNGKSCAECHALPSTGGSEPNVGVARETRISRILKGRFDPLDGSVSIDRGGQLLQQRAINVQGCTVKAEVVPPEATIVSSRNSTPLFGAGLIEAIPERTILGNQSNGGRPNYVLNPDTGAAELGRFGWKAQVATLHQFSGDAYLNELGITNPAFPHENRPQGEPIQPGCDTVGDPEDDGSGVTGFTNFMRFLAPAPRRPLTPQVQRGEQVFSAVGCASCHVPTMMTGRNSVAALSNKPVNLFSDLLLHDIGTGDGVEQGEAKGNDFRTPPLWGLSRRDRFMHDASSNKLEGAIQRHGGEAKGALNRYVGLPQSDRDALLAFLNSL
ncbi:MAG TPA: di-heme oxidoredictase family protein [Vicinamibacterales bacterium]|nr:di-heme oxidoredictase family protein [Vicinamibacterales bacterium]